LIPEILSLEELFERTLNIENDTSIKLKTVSTICKLEGDDQTFELILEMLKEQVEEVKMVQDILTRIKLCGKGLGEIIIDGELGHLK
jgi:ferritin